MPMIGKVFPSCYTETQLLLLQLRPECCNVDVSELPYHAQKFYMRRREEGRAGRGKGWGRREGREGKEEEGRVGWKVGEGKGGGGGGEEERRGGKEKRREEEKEG